MADEEADTPEPGDEPTRPDGRRPGPSTAVDDAGSGPLTPSQPAEEPEPEDARSASSKDDGPAEATRSEPPGDSEVEAQAESEPGTGGEANEARSAGGADSAGGGGERGVPRAEPDEPHDGPTGGGSADEAQGRDARRRKRRILVVGAAVVAVGVVAGWRVLAEGGAGRSPSQTVAAYFDAQRRGDCEQVQDLLTEDSWSRDGERSEGEFLDQCAAAMVGYRPAADQLTVKPSDDDEDEVLVYLGDDVYDEDPGPATLRREGGAWRVVPDDEVLPLGRSLDDTIEGYVDAYNRRDCDAMRAFLAEAMWSRDGELTEATYTDECVRMVDELAAPTLPLQVAMAEVRPQRRPDQDEPDRRTRAVSVERVALPSIDQGVSDDVVFVREGLAWQIAGFATRPDSHEVVPVASGPPILRFDWIELRERLVSEVTVAGVTCWTYLDGPASHPDGDEPHRAVRREFPSCPGLSTVVLRAFDDDESALAAAEELAAEEQDSGSGVADGEVTEEVPVPGIEGAFAVSTSCPDYDGCGSASAYGVRKGVLVSVHNIVGGPSTDDLVAVLEAQVERL